MNEILSKAVTAAQEKLPEAEQLRLAGLIDEFVHQSATNDLEADLEDPEYRKILEEQLRCSEEDRLNGRYSPAGEVFARLRSEFAEKHGL